MFTLPREMDIGCASKSSQQFHFDQSYEFVYTIKECLAWEKVCDVAHLEFFIRHNWIIYDQSEFFVHLFLWETLAKLGTIINNKMKILLNIVDKDTRELKAYVEKYAKKAKARK